MKIEENGISDKLDPRAEKEKINRLKKEYIREDAA